jgi:hypothetical protein
MMDSEPVKRMAVSPSAREKCIKRARKEVQFLDKWGYWPGIFYLTAGVLFIAMGFAFIVLLQHLAELGGNPQAQNGIWLGFMLGVVFGVITAFLTYKGGFYIVEGIGYLRGKPASRILVQYHDTLVNLMRDEERPLPSESDAPPSQESISASESN